MFLGDEESRFCLLLGLIVIVERIVDVNDGKTTMLNKFFRFEGEGFMTCLYSWISKITKFQSTICNNEKIPHNQKC